MQDVKTRVSEGGRIVLPAEYRRALGVSIGDEVMLRLEDGAVRIYTVRAAIRHAQELVRQYIPEDRSLVDELIAERRAEAERE